jgi:hypothetical protein
MTIHEHLDALAKLRFTSVTVIYEGSGDEGYTECQESIPEKHKRALEAYVENLLEPGWEINLGCGGSVKFNITLKRIEHSHEERVSNEVYKEWSY